jgi:hypothetical protein
MKGSTAALPRRPRENDAKPAPAIAQLRSSTCHRLMVTPKRKRRSAHAPLPPPEHSGGWAEGSGVDSGGDSSSSRAGRGGAQCADYGMLRASTPLYRLCRKNTRFLAPSVLGPHWLPAGIPRLAYAGTMPAQPTCRQTYSRSALYPPCSHCPGRADERPACPGLRARAFRSLDYAAKNSHFLAQGTRTPLSG